MRNCSRRGTARNHTRRRLVLVSPDRARGGPLWRDGPPRRRWWFAATLTWQAVLVAAAMIREGQAKFHFRLPLQTTIPAPLGLAAPARPVKELGVEGA